MNHSPLSPQGGQGAASGSAKPGRKPNTVAQQDYGEGFSQFWAVWPEGERKQDYVLCLELWKRKRLHRFADEIVQDVRQRIAESDMWRRGYVEAPKRYLRGSRWRDKPVLGVPSSALSWDATRAGIEAMGVRLGLGKWDEAEYERTHAHSAMFHVYAARVREAVDKAGTDGAD